MNSDLKELYKTALKLKKGTADASEGAKYISLSLKVIHRLENYHDDDIIYMIYYKYMLGLCWTRIADICGSFSPDAIRKSCTRCINRYEKAA